MDIIRPNSSYPSLHDGLHIYTGTVYSSAIGADKTARIVTDLRQCFFCSIQAVVNAGETTVPDYNSQIRPLGYLEGTDSINGTLYFDIKLPVGYSANYLIIGTDFLQTVTHSEVEQSASAVDGLVREAYFIVNYDFSSMTKHDSTFESDVAFVSSNPAGTGNYKITASSAVFSTTKTAVFATIEGTFSHANDSLIIRPKVSSTTEILFSVKGDGGVDADLTSDARVMIHIITFP